MLDYVERVVRARLREMPDGSWFAHGYHDHDGVSDAVYEIRCRLTKARRRRCSFDLTGTAPQAPGPINCARPALEGGVMGVILTFLCHDLPWAIGGLRPLVAIEVPDGTLVSAAQPGAGEHGVDHGDAERPGRRRPRLRARCCSAPSATAARRWPAGGRGSAAARSPRPRRRRTSIAMLSESFGGGGGARTFADGIDSGGVFHSMGVADRQRRGAREPRPRCSSSTAARRATAAARGASAAAPGSSTRSRRTSSRGTGRLITRSSGVACRAGAVSPAAPRARRSRASCCAATDVRERFARGRAAACARRSSRPRRRSCSRRRR